MLNERQRARLQAACAAEVQFDVSLKSYTTLRVGGTAAALVRLLDCDEVLFVIEFCKEEGLPWFCLGKGSNLFVADSGFAGVVFSLGGSLGSVEFFEHDNKESGVERGTTKRLLAGAGISLVRLAHCCTEHSLAGLEFASGIPGSLGGAVVMNAGAWGGEMAQVVRRVQVVSEKGVEWLNGEALDFTYRNWPFLEMMRKENPAVIAAVELELVVDDADDIRARCRSFTQKRKEAQQVHKPNAGSFFKNPRQETTESAGKLIELAGCKGWRVGDAMVSPEHANFFVNVGAATAADILELEKRVVNRVEESFAIELQREVHFIGGD